MARLKDYYKSEVAPALMKKFNYKSVMQIPKLDKIVINVGAGEAKENAKVIDAICQDIAAITGQKPQVCKAKKSVANFKLRAGMDNGVKVTLRGDRMYEFLDKMCIRDSLRRACWPLSAINPAVTATAESPSATEAAETAESTASSTSSARRPT